MFKACWQSLSLAPQCVSGCSDLLCFKPTDNPCLWLFREWMTALPCCFKPADNPYLWFSREWVPAVHCCVSSLLTTSVLGPPESEWLLCLAMFQACWQSLFLALQDVSGCCGLLCFKPAKNACSWLFSLWVATVHCCVSRLLTISVFNSSVGEWLLCNTVFQACWQSLSLALQEVSSCCALLCLKPADNLYPWHSSWWVTAGCVWSLLTTLVFGSLGSKWLLWLAMLQAWWLFLSLALQYVSSCCALLCFKPADNSCPWFSRMWVAACIAMFQACWQSLFSTLQEVSAWCDLLCLKPTDYPCPWLQAVSGCCASLYFKPANNPCSWPFSQWVAAVHSYVQRLLTIPVFGCSESEWLLCIAVFQACWQYLSFTLQWVGDCFALLCFRPADNPCSWLSRM